MVIGGVHHTILFTLDMFQICCNNVKKRWLMSLVLRFYSDKLEQRIIQFMHFCLTLSFQFQLSKLYTYQEDDEYP